eukprot:COSAG03_NODE_2541_length_2661_cov_6.439500_2_plen_77_part_00
MRFGLQPMRRAAVLVQRHASGAAPVALLLAVAAPSAFGVGAAAGGELRLAGVFGSDMVLQHGTPVVIATVLAQTCC